MSFRVTDVCRPVQMPPTPKNVLMAIADYADEQGHAFPGISKLCTATCYGKTAVIDALNWLEDAGYLKINRTRGEHNRYTVNLARLAERLPSARVDSGAAEAHSAQPETPARLPDQSGSRTSPGGEPVQQPDQSGSRTTPVRQADDHPSGSRTTPVRQADPNHHEPSMNHQNPPISAEPDELPKSSKRATSVVSPGDVDAQVWADWLQLRKTKRAPVTQTVIDGARQEAAKADLPLEDFLRVWCLRGSQGLEAGWLKPSERMAARNRSQVNAADLAAGAAEILGFTSSDNLPMVERLT